VDTRQIPNDGMFNNMSPRVKGDLNDLAFSEALGTIQESNIDLLAFNTCIAGLENELVARFNPCHRDQGFRLAS